MKNLTISANEVSADLRRFIERVEMARAKYSAKATNDGAVYPTLYFYPSEVADAARDLMRTSIFNSYLIPPAALNRKLGRLEHIPDMKFLFELYQEIWVDIYYAMGYGNIGEVDKFGYAPPSTALITIDDERHPDYISWKQLKECEKYTITIG